METLIPDEVAELLRDVLALKRKAIEILTPDEVGELLRISSNRVLLLARRGEIPFLTIDGRIRFDARDVENWVHAQRSDALIMPPRVVSQTTEASRERSITDLLADESGSVIGTVGAPGKKITE